MAFAPGQFITAQRLNRLQPKPYWAQASGTVAASSSGVDVPGASVNFTTETDGAQCAVDVNGAFYYSNIAGALANVTAVLDGSTVSPNFAVSQHASATAQRDASSATWLVTVPLAGLHTLKVRGTTGTNTVIQVYTGIAFQVFEVV